MKNIITIRFKNLQDFRNRIARCFQDQKENETYQFIFPDEVTEKEFNHLVNCFAEGQQGASDEIRRNAI